jgi:D-glycero-alpha-D-manno-heptose-7-phosphate kinase
MEDFGGVVLNTTINRFAHAIIEQHPEGEVEFVATDIRKRFQSAPAANLEPGNDLPLHVAVYNEMVRTVTGGEPFPVKITTFCDAPVGSGLGSSSTMTAAIINAYNAYLQLDMGKYEVARVAFDIERNILGLAGGRQDQYAAAFGGFNFIEFHQDDTVLVNQLRLDQPIQDELESWLVLYFTGTSRSSAQIISSQVEAMKASESAVLESMHAIKELAWLMKDRLYKNDIEGFASLVDQSWQEKIKTSTTITNPEIDHLFAVAKESGAIGGKVTGAGGGGFMMLFCPPERRSGVLQALDSEKGTVYPFSFFKRGAHAWKIHRDESAL